MYVANTGRKCLSACLFEDADTWKRRQRCPSLHLGKEAASPHSHGGAFTFLPSVHEALFTEMLAIILFDFSDALGLVCLRLMRH